MAPVTCYISGVIWKWDLYKFLNFCNCLKDYYFLTEGKKEKKKKTKYEFLSNSASMILFTTLYNYMRELLNA